MTDDIVTRLRYIYSQKDVGVSLNPETFVEAADEIERLQAELFETQKDFNLIRKSRERALADIEHHKKWCDNYLLEIKYLRKEKRRLAKCCYILGRPEDEGLSDWELLFLEMVQDRYERVINE